MNNPSPENLTPFEDFIVVIDDNYESERTIHSGWGGGMSERVPASKKYNGEPYQVLGVNAPFICCKAATEEKTFQIDIRHVEWRHVKDDYVKGYLLGNGLLERPASKEEIQQQKNDKKHCCPICVEPMTQRYGVKSGWSMICKECDVQLTRIKK